MTCKHEHTHTNECDHHNDHHQTSHKPIRTIVKRLGSNHRLSHSILNRLPFFKIQAGAISDNLSNIILSTGEALVLNLPHHTHLHIGDILLDAQGLMVRVDAMEQSVLSVQVNPDLNSISGLESLLNLALKAQQQGHSLGFDKETGALLLTQHPDLKAYLIQQGFSVSESQGILNFNAMLPLNLPEIACNHEHH